MTANLEILEDDQEISQFSLENVTFLSAETVKKLCSELGDISIHSLMSILIEYAKKLSEACVSKFVVGCVGYSRAGNMYLGANFEFPGLPQSHTIHAEYSLISNMLLHEDYQLCKLLVTAPPCGHCRQLLYELFYINHNNSDDDNNDGLDILIESTATKSNLIVEKIQDLLPYGFKLVEEPISECLKLNKKFSVIENSIRRLNLCEDEENEKRPKELDLSYECKAKALEIGLKSAALSISPYTHSESSVVFTTKSGNHYSGMFVEGAAFNPCMPPFKVALVGLLNSGETLEDVVHVLLLEKQNAIVSQKEDVRALVSYVTPSLKNIHICYFK